MVSCYQSENPTILSFHSHQIISSSSFAGSPAGSTLASSTEPDLQVTQTPSGFKPFEAFFCGLVSSVARCTACVKKVARLSSKALV